MRDYNKYLTVSFVRTISESFSNIARSVNLKPAFIILNTLKKYITTRKNTLEKEYSAHYDVYKISCHDYASYIGQTKRKLKTRIIEHSSNIKIKNQAHQMSYLITGLT